MPDMLAACGGPDGEASTACDSDMAPRSVPASSLAIRVLDERAIA